MDNKSDIIQVADGVTHSRIADNFVIHIQPFLAAAGQHGLVTSMKRAAADQYRIIYQYGISRGLFKASDCTLAEFPARPYQYEGQATFFWVWVWSTLLEMGLLIAPPVGPTAILLGTRRGQIRNPSTHIRGLALDFKGTDVAPTIEAAVKTSPEIAALVERVLVERENDATHIDLKEVSV